MIVGLKGIIEEIGIGSIVINVRDIFYEIGISYLCASKLSPGKETKIFVTEIIREDSHLFFGFLDKEEKTLFDRLIKINGVGPRVAMAILSTYEPEKFVQIIKEKNISALQKVSGIGSKGASKIMVDLAGFFDFDLETDKNQTNKKDAIKALENLGFKKTEIQEAIKNINCNETAQIIKEALKNLQNI